MVFTIVAAIKAAIAVGLDLMLSSRPSYLVGIMITHGRSPEGYPRRSIVWQGS